MNSGVLFPTTNVIDTYVSVSYTHLDVYKRQDESGVAAASGRGIYESVRTDHHEPLGQGGTGAQS